MGPGLSANSGTAGYSVQTLILVNNTLSAGNQHPPNGVFPGPWTGSIAYDSRSHRVFVVAGSNAGVVAVLNGTTHAFVTAVSVGGYPNVVSTEAANGEAYVGGLGSKNLTIINTTTSKIVKTLAYGADAAAMAYDPSNRCLYVGHDNTGTYGNITVVNTTTDKVAGTIVVGNNSVAVAYDPVNGMVYAANLNRAGSRSHDNVSVIRPSTNGVVATVSVGAHPVALAVDTVRGDVYVANRGSGYVSVINASTNSVTSSVALSSAAGSVAYDGANHEVYAASNQGDFVAAIATSNLTVLRNVSVGGDPSALAFAGSSHDLYVPNAVSGNVSIMSTSTNRLVATVATGRSPDSLAVDPADGYVYVPNSGSDTVTAISSSNRTGVATTAVGFYPGPALLDPLDGELFIGEQDPGWLTAVNLSTNKVVAQIPVGSYPAGMAVDTANGLLYVHNKGSANVSAINGTTNSVVASVPVGNGGSIPNGPVAYDPVDQEVYVTNYMSSNVSVINGTRVVASIPVGLGPDAVTCDPATGVVFVENSGSYNVSVISPKTNKVIGSVGFQWGRSLQGLAYDPANGNVYVLNTGPNNLSVISGATNKAIANVSVGMAPTAIAFDTVRNTAYVIGQGWTSTEVSIVAGSTNKLLTTVALKAGPGPIVVDGRNGTAYAGLSNGNVDILDTATGNLTGVVPIGSGLWSLVGPTPAGHVYTTNRYDGTVSILTPPASFPVNFTETGLPNGTNWSVDINGTLHASRSGTVSVPLRNGSYVFEVDPIAGYAPTPENGTFTVNGIGFTRTILFRPTYTVTFQEKGLPNGTTWEVALNGTTNRSSASSLHFAVPNGTYAYKASNLAGYRASQYSGSVTVKGGGQSVTVNWTRTVYPVRFNETGLPNGTLWGVALNGSTNTSKGASVGFEVPNGTYAFNLSRVSGWQANRTIGSLTVNGTLVYVASRFARFTYPVTFNEIGLPTGCSWAVTLNGTTNRSAVNALSFRVPNGSYPYNISGVPGYFLHLYRSTIAVNGSGATVTLSWSPFTYFVTFTEAGLPPGTAWGVRWNGTTNTTTGTAVTFTASNGTAPYHILGVPGWRTDRYNGSATVRAGPLSLSVPWTPMSYEVRFAEDGLAFGTLWGVTWNGTLQRSQNDTITFNSTNGTYAYAIASVPGWTSGVYQGQVTVAGLPRQVSVSWVEVTYRVVFVETGLPSGTNWSVTLDGRSIASVQSTVSFDAPNGSHPYQVGDVPGWQASANSGTIVVAAADVRVAVDWNQTRYAVTFQETTLPSGVRWSVTLGSATNSSTGPSIRFLEPNGTYAFDVAKPAGWSTQNASGRVAVSGRPMSVLLPFTRVTYSVSFVESGLPPSAYLPTGAPIQPSWSVILNGTNMAGAGRVIFQGLPNGSYPFTVTAIAGFDANPSQGTIEVRGGNVTESITFLAIPSHASDAPPRLLGLAPVEAYALLAALVVVIAGIAATILFSRRRRHLTPKEPPEPT